MEETVLTNHNQRKVEGVTQPNKTVYIKSSGFLSVAIKHSGQMQPGEGRVYLA